MGDKRSVPVKGHLRGNVAVGDYVQMRDTQDQHARTDRRDMREMHSMQLGDMANDPPSSLQVGEWKALIRGKTGSGAPEAKDAYGPDGSLNVGKKRLVISVSQQIVSYYDDQETKEIEEIPSEFEAREVYTLDVPDGASVDYETINEAVRSYHDEKFAPLIADKVYGSVGVDSVLVQEWEVTPHDDPKKVWVRRREMWENGEPAKHTDGR